MKTSTVRRLRPALALLGVLGMAGWTAACPGRAPAPAVACAPEEGELAPGERIEAIAGTYRLTLVARQGALAGASASGRLRLEPFGSRPQPVPAADRVRYALFGGTDVDLARVGAVALGSVSQADPARPGVLAMEWAKSPSPEGSYDITLRLGADANHGSQQRFDGTYTSLRVRGLTANGFAGTWESGAGQPVASGYFCAERITG